MNPILTNKDLRLMDINPNQIERCLKVGIFQILQ